MEDNQINEKKNELNLLDTQIKDLKKKKKRQIHILIFLFAIILSVVALEVILTSEAVPSTTFDGDTGFFGVGTLIPSQQLDVRGHINVSGDIWTQNSTRVNDWLYNQTSSSAGNFNYNETTYLLSIYSKFWNNQTQSITNGYQLYWYNQSQGSFNQYGIYWYNQTSVGNLFN